eukprot:623905-Hanusia_phi.AAC.1
MLSPHIERSETICREPATQVPPGACSAFGPGRVRAAPCGENGFFGLEIVRVVMRAVVVI